MPISHIDPVRDVFDPPQFGQDHPMRKVTRQVAFDGGWDATRAGKVADLFDSMADEWTANHGGEDRTWSLEDALDRGLASAPTMGDGRVLELGSGTGLGTRVLAQRFSNVVAMDLSAGMLRNAPAELAARVRADSVQLPLRDGAASVVVLVNMLLFPDEIDRVLAADGALVWVNTLGEGTPIHLPADDVAAALPGSWDGVASRAGHGTWAVVRRS